MSIWGICLFQTIRRSESQTVKLSLFLTFCLVYEHFSFFVSPGFNLNTRDQKLLYCNMRNAHTETVKHQLLFLLLSLCMHACLIHCPPNRLWKLAHFPNTMMSCGEWKKCSVPGLFHPFVWPMKAKGVTVKEVIFKCIYSAPTSTPSTHLLLPPHHTVSSACLPILSFSISLINQQITAMTATHCFARVNSLKWILTGLAWEYISYYACQLCTTGPFASPPKKKNG